jgi:tetratricopeptide (TPR) repeat protein
MLGDLYAHLATAANEEQSKPVVEAIERLWLYSGSDTINLLMERALRAVAEKRQELALKLLDAVTELAPDFAEGWNRRAYVYYTQNDYERAMGDLRRVLALEPGHFKAMDGLAQIFKETGNKKGALKAYKELMQIYPNSPGVEDSIKELSREVEGQGI